MIRIDAPGDLDWDAVMQIAWGDARVTLGDELLAAVDAGRTRFDALIARGVPCYGLTTGLGKLVTTSLDGAAQAEIPRNVLIARAAAFGDPLPPQVARATQVIRLVNFLSARAAVGSALCRFLVDRLNDDFTPWIPALGHGMASDAIAHSHAFQTLIGEGHVFGPDGDRQAAAAALAARGVEPFSVSGREGLALINGVCASPALALHVYRELDEWLGLAQLVAAASIEGLAAPRDAYAVAVAAHSSAPGIARAIDGLGRLLAGSEIEARILQAPVSYRVVPQVHGALYDALAGLRASVERCLVDYSDNPLLDGERLLSVGCFHNQHLVNDAETVALALAQAAVLAERRLHRLLDAGITGLSPQLAARPGIDAGLVAAHKAAIDCAARLRVLAQPVSLYTGETSAGQEDFMALAIPALARLLEMVELGRALLACELLAALAALRQRDARPGAGVAALIDKLGDTIAPYVCDRSPGPDVEALLVALRDDRLRGLL